MQGVEGVTSHTTWAAQHGAAGQQSRSSLGFKLVQPTRSLPIHMKPKYLTGLTVDCFQVQYFLLCGIIQILKHLFSAATSIMSFVGVSCASTP